MSRLIRLFLFTLCCLPFALARASDAPLEVAPQPGVVLLRNGQVLSGKITRAGDDYYVALATGEIRLNANQVELVCRDLREGYERKRDRIDPIKVSDHLDLALWCVRQELLDDASCEIEAARKLDPRHPRVALVERQLKLAQQQPSHVTAVSTPGAGPSPEDLDRLLRGMPPGTVETFSNTIQPLLLNTCGNAGCHGPQSAGKLRLLRTQMGKMSSRRFTQRNLHAVMEMIDRQDPPASLLLTAPVAPHGTAKAPIFTSREAVQYRQLVQWVMRVASGTAPEAPASVERPDDHLLQQFPASAAPPTPKIVVNPLFGSRGEATAAAPAKPPGKRPPLPTVGEEEEPAVDPFDPEVFNRQFAPDP